MNSISRLTSNTHLPRDSKTSITKYVPDEISAYVLKHKDVLSKMMKFTATDATSATDSDDDPFDDQIDVEFWRRQCPDMNFDDEIFDGKKRIDGKRKQDDGNEENEHDEKRDEVD